MTNGPRTGVRRPTHDLLGGSGTRFTIVGRREVRAVLRDPGSEALVPGPGASGLQEHARAGGPRRPGRLPRVLDRRAPLPRGVLALLEPRGPLRRGRGPHHEHPHRLRSPAPPAAVQPPGPVRRVRRGPRPALRRPGRLRHRPLLDPSRARGLRGRPDETRQMWREALDHIVSAWTEDEYEADGEYWSMPPAPRAPEAAPEAPPADLGRHEQRRRAPRGRRRDRAVLVHRRAAAGGAGEEHRRTARARECDEPVGKFKNETAATFTMVNCAPTSGGVRGREELVRVVPEDRRRTHRSVAEWMEGTKQELGTYQYAASPLQHQREGAFEHLNFDYYPQRRRRCRRRPGRVHRDLPALRGRGRRPAAVPGQPVRHPARQGDAVHRADREVRHPRVHIAEFSGTRPWRPSLGVVQSYSRGCRGSRGTRGW